MCVAEYDIVLPLNSTQHGLKLKIRALFVIKDVIWLPDTISHRITSFFKNSPIAAISHCQIPRK